MQSWETVMRQHISWWEDEVERTWDTYVSGGERGIGQDNKNGEHGGEKEEGEASRCLYHQCCCVEPARNVCIKAEDEEGEEELCAAEEVERVDLHLCGVM